MEPAWPPRQERRERHSDSCAHDRLKRKKDAEAEQDITKQNVPVLVGFRAVYVFDVLQTEGKELPGMDGVKGEVGEHRDR